MTETIVKVPRAELVDALRARDGDVCAYPDCGETLDFAILEGRHEVTIDHWIPQVVGKAQGWATEKIWALDNLKLMHRKCNAAKGDRVPDEQGILPAKPERTWKNRRAKRLNRPEVCTECNAGRKLAEDEWCNACGSGPQPARYPRWRQMSPADCDHDLFFCAACHVYNPSLRRSVLNTLLVGGNGYETIDGDD